MIWQNLKEKEINRDSLSELSFKNTSGVAYSVKDLLEWAQDWAGVGERYDDEEALTMQGSLSSVRLRMAAVIIFL